MIPERVWLSDSQPIKRMIQRLITQPLANEILKGTFKTKDNIRVDVKDGKIVFE